MAQGAAPEIRHAVAHAGGCGGPGAAEAQWGRREAGLLGLATPCRGARLSRKGQGGDACC